MYLNIFLVLLVLIIFVIWKISTSPGPNLKAYFSLRCTPKKIATKVKNEKYLVIGGNGCVGSHIVEALLARGEKDITIFDMSNFGLFENEKNVTFTKGNICDEKQILDATKGKTVVFHTASLINPGCRLPSDYQRFYNINVKGTENVLNACIQNKVKKLIYTSSISVLQSFNIGTTNGKDDDEYAKPPFLGHYLPTKAEAERIVLASNGKGGLLTGAVRPTGVYGPRDVTVVNLLYKSQPAIGINEGRTDYVYVENVAHGHLLLEEKLYDGSPAAGQAFTINNETSGRSKEVLKRLSDRIGNRFIYIPHLMLLPFAHVIEFLLAITKGKFPTGDIAWLTPGLIQICEQDAVFSYEKAKKVLGYEPLYTLDEGFDISAEWLKSIKK